MSRKIVIVCAVGVIAVAAVWLGMNLGTDNTDVSAVQNKTVPESPSDEAALASKETYKPSDASHEDTYSTEKLSTSVKALLGLDGNDQNYNSLKAAVTSLSNDLSMDDIAALRAMLTWPNEKFPGGMRDIEINTIKNDVLDRLLRQNELPEGIGMQMVDMASNQDNDSAWRDYCIQFMTPFYERAAGMEEPPMGELGSVRETMFAALNERAGTLAGTSLIGLELLSRTHDEFDRDTIAVKASEIAADESASAACRMTALRMSSVMGVDDTTADTARDLAQTGKTVLLRSSAIVTLGETGSEDDRELLESFASSDDRQIASAAKLALQKLDARN